MDPALSSNAKLPFWAALHTVMICVLFGSNAVAIKISVTGMGPFTVAALRFSIASALLWVWAKATGQRLTLDSGQVKKILLLSIIFTAQLSLFHLGISKTLASRGTLLANFQPFFLLLLAHYFIPGDSMTAKKVVGLFLGFLGVLLVFFESKGARSDFRSGDLMVLFAALLWAVNGVYTKRIVSGISPYQLVFYPMVFSLPFFFLEAWLWDATLIGSLDARVIGSLLYQSVLCAAFGFVAWTRLLKRYGAVALHSFIFIMPIAGVFLGGLVLGEPITVKIFLALSFVVVGIFIVQLKEKAAPTLIFPGRSL